MLPSPGSTSRTTRSAPERSANARTVATASAWRASASCTSSGTVWDGGTLGRASPWARRSASARPTWTATTRPRWSTPRGVAAEGVTFGDGPFHLDPVPRVISADDWSALEAGLLQRVRALDAFCADVYGERRIVATAWCPARVIETIDTLEPALRGCRCRSLGRDRGARRGARAGRPLPRARGQPAHAERDGLRGRRARHDSDAAAAGAPAGAGRRAARHAAAGARGRAGRAVLTDGPSNTAYWEHQLAGRAAGDPAARAGRSSTRRRSTSSTGARTARQLDSSVGRLLHGATGAGRERVRGRRRRRQARARVRRGHGALLPRRGAAARLGADVRPRPPRGARGGARPDRRAGRQAARRLRRRRRGDLPARRRARTSSAVRDAVRGAPEDYIAQELVPLSEHPTVVDGAARRSARRPAAVRVPRRRTARARATRAGSRAWRWTRARWS